MAKHEWLYCGNDWNDITNIIKLEKNPKNRLQEFNDILQREKLTINDIFEVWCVLQKDEIQECVADWFYDEDIINTNEKIYWFFNIYTGEALHIKYVISYSGIVTD